MLENRKKCVEDILKCLDKNIIYTEIKRKIEPLTDALNQLISTPITENPTQCLAVDLDNTDITKIKLKQACHRMDDIENQAKLIKHQIQNINNKIDDNSIVKNIDEDLIMYQLKIIENCFTDVYYSESSKILEVTTNDIILEDVELGHFRIALYLIENFTDLRDLVDCIRVTPLTPNFANGSVNVPHPHVKDESICLGNTYNLVFNALIEGRIADVFNIINDVLNSYNSTDAHSLLENWHDVICDACEEICLPEDLMDCSVCDSKLCDMCYGWCEICCETICPNHRSRCEIHENFICKSCALSCAECYILSCTLLECKMCSELFCKCCAENCDHCDNTICNTCSYLCENCPDGYTCDECVIRCDKCNKNLCTNCILECNNCKEYCCKVDCYDNHGCTLFENKET